MQYKEAFSDSIEFFVIHLQNTPNERKENIIKLKDRIHTDLYLFNAIDGNLVDKTNLSSFDNDLVINFEHDRGVGEYGCYLSHLMVYKWLIFSKKEDGYTVILEDDANILSDTFFEDVKKIINSVDDFDIIFLGNLGENHGDHYIDNIYHIDVTNFLTGTHAYVVNNSKVAKIYSLLLTMSAPIDIKYKDLIDDGKLKCFVIYPVLVEQEQIFSSTIAL